MKRMGYVDYDADDYVEIPVYDKIENVYNKIEEDDTIFSIDIRIWKYNFCILSITKEQ